jgi:hypothetical protein
MLVWREGNTGQSGNWTGPFKLLGIEGETCRVELPSGPTDFHSTTVKPYHQTEPESEEEETQERIIEEPEETNDPPVAPRQNSKRGRQNPDTTDATIFLGVYFKSNFKDKEKGKTGTTPKNWKETPKPSFIKSRCKEINGLLEKKVFEFIHKSEIPKGTRIFDSRFIDEIKNEGTTKAYEKSRLVIQAYNDQGKNMILTQSPTIQRVSQRIILALAMTLKDKTGKSLSVYLCDIPQVYIQSRTPLVRDFFA